MTDDGPRAPGTTRDALFTMSIVFAGGGIGLLLGLIESIWP